MVLCGNWGSLVRSMIIGACDLRDGVEGLNKVVEGAETAQVASRGLEGSACPRTSRPSTVLSDGVDRVLTLAGRELRLLGISPCTGSDSGCAPRTAVQSGQSRPEKQELASLPQSKQARYDELGTGC